MNVEFKAMDYLEEYFIVIYVYDKRGDTVITGKGFWISEGN